MLEKSIIKIAAKRTKIMSSCSNRNRIENSSDLLLLKKTFQNQKLLQFSAINSHQNYNHITSSSSTNKIQSSTETIKNNNIENCIFDIEQSQQILTTESDDYHSSQQDTLTISTSTTTTTTVRKFPSKMSLTDDSDNEDGSGGVNNNGVNVCTGGHHNNVKNSTTDISMLSSLCIFSSLRTRSLPPTLCASISCVITLISSTFLKRQRRCRIVLPAFDFLLIATIFSFLLLMIGDVRNGVAALQHRDLNQNQLKKPEPMFISRSETFKFVAGSTMLLPCEVADTAEFVVAWKRGIAILSAGSVKVTPDPRVRLVNGFNLQIRDAVPQDAGDYICQIAMLEPREITHTVEILVPPRIHHISSGGHLQVKKGASVRIECSASGNPTPNVTWSRKNNILPNGDEMLHSTILSVENMDRHKGGVYICKANNGVGQPASSQVVLHVLYPPEISVERPVVYSGEGHEAMLVCIVHGEAQPEVIWFKETMQLDTTERHIMENRGSRHTLIIRKVHPQDFGNYSCVAENQLGKSRKTLQLSGKPNTAVFSSPPISQYKDRYNISWTVDSHTPVEEFKLYFRRLPQGHEVDNTIEQPMHLSSSSSLSMHMYGINSGGGGSNNIGSNNNNINSHNNHRGGYNVHWPRSDWRDVVLPAVPLSHHYTQGMSYMIRGLEPDQHYEAKVNARNRYGWSDLTESFLFSTSSNDAYLDPSSFRNLGLSDNEMRDLSVTFYGSSAHSLSTHTTINQIVIIQILCILVKILKFLHLV